MTQIRSFDNIQAANVAEANEKLYFNREEGFVGTGLKKDEFIATARSIDEFIIFYRDGRYKITKVQDKLFVGKGVIYINVYKRNDQRTIYNVIYRTAVAAYTYMKRFAATGMSRDKEYSLIPATVAPGAKIVWFSANPNGEAEVVKVTLKPKRASKPDFDVDSQVGHKGPRGAG